MVERIDPNKTMWLGHTRWWWVKAAYVFLVLMISLTFFIDYRNSQRINNEIIERQRASIEVQRASCERDNELRLVVLDIVISATEGGSAADLTAVPSFRNIQDPEVVQYLTDLNELLRSNTEPSPHEERLVEFARERLQPLDCSIIPEPLERIQ